MRGRPTRQELIDAIDAEHAAQHALLAMGADLLPKLNEIAARWGDSEYTCEARFATVGFPTSSLSHQNLSLEIHLGPDDRVTDAIHLVTAVRNLPGVTRRSKDGPLFRDSDATQTREYQMRYTAPFEGAKPVDLQVRIWVSTSTRCTFQPTGETKPVLALVCE